MSNRLASAYVEIHPWLANNFSSDLARQMGGTDLTKPGRKAGDTFAAGMAGRFADISKASGNVGSSLTKYITTPALGAASAVGSIFLAKGWNRLANIDTAQSKLNGLGYSAEQIQDVMDRSLAAVKGTAFGLDEAASVAGMALASGIEPGERLQEVLTTIGDTATIAGASFSDIGPIFSSVMARDKLQGDDMLQLTSRGVPVLQSLSKQLGVTTEDVSQMVSKGEIDFATFEAAMRQSFSGAAQASGESMTGTINNVGAAVGRLGAAFLDAGGNGEGFFSKLKPFLSDLISNLDSYGDTATEWGSRVGEAFTQIIDSGAKAIEIFDKLPEPVKQSVTQFALLSVAAGPSLKIFSALSGGAGKLFGTLKGGSNALKSFRKNMETVRITAALGKDNMTGWAASVGGFASKSNMGSKAVGGLAKTLSSASYAVPVLGAAFAAFSIVNFIKDVNDARIESEYFSKSAELLAGNATKISDAFKEGASGMRDTNNLITASGQTVEQLNQTIATCEGNITSIMQQAVSEHRALRQEEIDSINEQTAQMEQAYALQAEAIQKQNEFNAKYLSEHAGEMTAEQQQSYLGAIEQGTTNLIEAENNRFDKQNAVITQGMAAGLISEEDGYARMEAAATEHNRKLDQIGKDGARAFDSGTTAMANSAGNVSRAFTEMLDSSIDFERKFSVDRVGADLGNLDSRFFVTKEQWARAWSSMSDSAKTGAQDILSAAGTAAKSGDVIDGAMAEAVESVLYSFDGLRTDAGEAGKEALMQLLDGVTNSEVLTQGIDLANANCQEIVDGIRQNLELEPIAKEELSRFTAGLQEGFTYAVPIAQGGVQSVLDSFTPIPEKLGGIGNDGGVAFMTYLGSGIFQNESGVYVAADSLAANILTQLTGKDYTSAGGLIDAGLAQGMGDGVESKLKAAGLGDGAIEAIMKAIGAASPSVKAAEAGSFIDQGLAQGMTTGTAAKDAAQQLGTGVMDALSQTLSVESASFTQIGTGIGAGIASGLTGTSGIVAGAASSVANVTTAAFTAVEPKALTSGSQAGQNFANGIKSAQGPTQSGAANLYKAVDAQLSKAPAQAQRYGSQAGQNFANGIASARGSVSSASSSLASATTAMRGYISSAYSWGSSQGTNYASGLRATAPAVASAAAAIAQAAASPLKHSTPKIGALKGDDKWGYEQGYNYAKSMMKSIPLVERSSLAMAQAASFTPEWGAPSASSYALSRAASAPVTNINIDGVRIAGADAERITDVLFEVIPELHRIYQT